MIKKVFLLFIFILLVSSCNNNDEIINDVSFNEIKLDNAIFDEDKNVSSIEIIDVPAEIKIGHFSSFNIKFKINYVDETVSYKRITEEMFSEELLEEFLNPGDKYFDFVYKNNHISLRFKLIESENPVYFNVEFKDRNGNLLETKSVKYLNSVTYNGPKDLDYIKDEKYYRFNGNWSEDLSHVYSNMVLYPKYDECGFVNHFDDYFTTKEYSDFMIYEPIKTYNEGNNTHGLIYVGRMENAILKSYGKIERTEYEATQFKYNQDDLSVTEFYQDLGDNIKKNIILDKYVHKDEKIDLNFTIIYNLSKLNLDLSKNNEYEYENNKYNISSCISVDFSNYNLTENDGYQRNDNIKTSVDNIFNLNDKKIYDKYLNGGSINITEDYPLGTYNLSMMADLDIYLDLTFMELTPFGQYPIYYQINDVKLGFAMAKDSLRFGFTYSNNEDINSFGNKITIYDSIISHTLPLVY